MRLGKHWTARLDCEWASLLRPGRYNWHTFTFVRLDVERETYMRSDEGAAPWDIHVGLLGFHLYLSNAYDYDWSHEKDDAPAAGPGGKE